MKHTILIALLGAAITFAAPSVSYADKGQKYQTKRLDQNHSRSHGKKDHRYKKNNHNKQKRFVEKKSKKRQFVQNKQGHRNKHGYNKHGFNKHGYNRHGYNKHGYNKHGYNKHKQRHHSYSNHKNKPSFSISWNVGDSTISYGNDWDNGYYNNGYYNNGHRKNRGKRIYQRLNNQANRIQRGINNGQLVKREVRKLRHDQRDIKQTLNHYKRDGHLNRHERSKLNHLLDVASNRINRKSNNHLTRYTRHHNQYVQF